MADFDYSDTDWEAIERLKKWYSGDIHDSMEALGLWGCLEGISLLGALRHEQEKSAKRSVTR